MTSERFLPEWSAADVDAARLWAACGGQWLTDPEVAVPVELVSNVVGVSTWLDDAGAGLGGLFGSGGLGVLTERAAMQQLGPSGRVSCGGASRLVRCLDGWIAVSLARPDDFAAVPAWLESDSCDWSTIERALASATVAATVERAGLLGLACAAVGERVAAGSGIRTETLGDAAPKRVDELVVVAVHGVLVAAQRTETDAAARRSMTIICGSGLPAAIRPLLRGR